MSIVTEWDDKLQREIAIDTHRLLDKLVQKACAPVIVGGLPLGVAICHGTTFLSFHDLADYFGLSITDFEVEAGARVQTVESRSSA